MFYMMTLYPLSQGSTLEYLPLLFSVNREELSKIFQATNINQNSHENNKTYLQISNL